MNPAIRKSKIILEISMYAHTAPNVRNYQGEELAPVKVEVVMFEYDPKGRGKRGYILVTGMSVRQGWSPRSARFNINGYSYPEPPQWLVDLVEEVLA